MSDMTFKQAKELVERLELAEVSIQKSTDDLNQSASKFRESLKKQALLVKLIPQTDKKLNILRLMLALNVGIIIGFVAAVYFMN